MGVWNWNILALEGRRYVGGGKEIEGRRMTEKGRGRRVRNGGEVGRSEE